LRKQFEGSKFQTESDCEVILALQRKGPHFIDEMNGNFFLALPFYEKKDEYFVARDHMGIIPLYIGWDEHGTFMLLLN
jgi:asparagine synthase (glutamine-hydrolysing)